MLQIAKMSILSCRFLKLQNYFPPCVSCLFGKVHRQPWRHKSPAESSGGGICSSDINKPGQQVGTDQILSSQPGRAPQ